MNLDQETVGSLWERWVQPSSLTRRVELEFGGIPVVLVTNDDEVAREVRSYYREFLGAPRQNAICVTAIETHLGTLEGAFAEQEREEGKQGLKEMFLELRDGRVVRKVRTGMHFVFGGHRHLAIGPCRENLPQIVNFINNRVIERLLRQDYLLGHASGLVLGARCAAICGFSGAGKSTLALHVLADDDAHRQDAADPMALLSNDRILFHRDDRRTLVHGVAKHPRINPGTILGNSRLHSILTEDEIAKFQAMPLEELWHLEQKYDCLTHSCFGENRFVLRSELHAVYFLTWQRNSSQPTAVRQVNLRDRVELLPALMKRPGLFFQTEQGQAEPEMGIEQYLDHLQHVQIFEVSGKVDFEAASASIRSFLAQG